MKMGQSLLAALLNESVARQRSPASPGKEEESSASDSPRVLSGPGPGPGPGPHRPPSSSSSSSSTKRKTTSTSSLSCDLEPSQCLCLQALQASNFSMLNTKKYHSWFDGDSVMQLAQAGTYHGTDAIREYVEFLDSSTTIFSSKIGLIYDILPIPESISYQKDSRLCTATFVIDACSDLSDRVEMGKGSIDHTGMYKLSYNIEHLPQPLDPEASMALIKVKRANVFSPHQYLEHLFKISHTKAVAKEVCDIMRNQCSETFDANFPKGGGEEEEEEDDDGTDKNDKLCIEAMMQLKTIDEEGHFDGNSFACRVLHSAMAATNPLHCPHISILPMKDANGKVKCQESQNIEPTDLFSLDDIAALNQFAIDNFNYKPTDMMFQHIQGKTCSQRHPEFYKEFDTSPMILSTVVICLIAISAALILAWVFIRRGETMADGGKEQSEDKSSSYYYPRRPDDEEDASVPSTHQSSDSSSSSVSPFDHDGSSTTTPSTTASTSKSIDSDDHFEDNVIFVKDEENDTPSFLHLDKSNKQDQYCSSILSWTGVSCTYHQTGPRNPSPVLVHASGSLAPGDFMAIMGPSGGGKSTLLDIIAGRKNLGTIRGEISFLGKTLCASDYKANEILRKGSVYIPQEVDFLPNQTPAEAVFFATNLLYGPHDEDSSIEEESDTSKLVYSTLSSVGLSNKVLHLPIGGESISGAIRKGLSVGQRKKLALACALVQKPKILFIDEITSGLDSESALMVVQLIRNLCFERNIAVVMVIHQPSSMMFDMFDKLALVSSGHVLCSDFRKTSLQDMYASTFKKPFPSNHELPHQLLKDSQCFFLEEKNSLQFEMNKIEDLDLAPTTSSSTTTNPNLKDSDHQHHVSMMWKFFVVFQRNLMNNYARDSTILLLRLAIVTVLSLALGLAGWQMGSTLESTGLNGILSPIEAKNLSGAILVLFMISYLVPFFFIGAFFAEKKFFLAESSLGLYSSCTYCISLILSEASVLVLIQSIMQASITIPMLGVWNPIIPRVVSFMTALSIIIPSNLVGNGLVLLLSVCLPSPALAFLFAAGVVLVWFLFSGGIIVFPSLAYFISWVQWISPVKYSLQAFTTLMFWDTASYEVYVEMVGYDQPKAIISNIAILYLIFFLFSILTVFALSRQSAVH